MSEMMPGESARHFWLTRSVARAMGLSLSEAIAQGRINGDEYGRMVARCRMCQFVNDCESWLSRQAGLAETTPDNCAHTEVLHRVKMVQRRP